MGDAFDPNRFLDEGEAELQQQAPQAVASNFDANSFLDQGEQEFKQMSGAKQAALQPLVPQQAQMAPPMFTPPTAGPPMFQPTPKQTAPNQFDLGAVAGDFINSIPVVKEAKKSTPVNVAGNIVGGVPYGLAQVGDALKFLAPYVDPIGEMTKRGTGKMIEQATGLKQQEGPQSMAKEYQNFFQNMVNDAYLPEAFKTGGMLGQATLPAGIGAQANTLRGAVGLGALENALQSGVSSIGEQLADKGKVDALDTALSTALGGTIGGLFGGGGYGAKVAKEKGGEFLNKLLMGKGEKVAQAAPTGPITIDTPAGPVPVPQQGTELPKPVLPTSMIGGAAPKASREVRQSVIDKVLGYPPKPDVIPDEVPPEGSFRHRREGFGRNKVDDALPVSQFDQVTQRAVQNIAEAKQLLDYRKAVLDDYTQKLWDNLEKAGIVSKELPIARGANKAILKKEEVKRLNVHQEEQLAKIRAFHASGVEPTNNKQHVAAISGNQYGVDNAFGNKLPDFKVYEDVDKAFEALALLDQSVKATEKMYKAEKTKHEAILKAAQKEMRKTNPQASFNAKTQVFGPMKGQVSDVAVSLDYGAMRLKLTEEAKAIVKQAEDKMFQEQAADRHFVPKTKFTIQNTAQAVKKRALAVIGAAFVATGRPQAAEAAEIGGIGGEEHKNDFDYGALARLAVGMALLHKGAPKLAKKLVNPENVIASALFTDTIQRVEALDKVLDTNLVGDFWKKMGLIHNASFGNKMDEETRAQAMDLLKQGKMDEFDQLNLTADEKYALTIYDRVKASLAEQIDNQIANVNDFINQGGDATKLKNSISALKEMRNSLVSKESNIFEEFGQGRVRNFMDFHFFYNPAFHLTNLSDMFISGMPRVGPGNLTKALRDLGPGGDKELKELFKNSNMTGGFKQEKLHAGARSDGFHFKLKDFESDKINADRVTLGALYQYKQVNGAINGYKGTDQQFVKDLMAHKLDPSLEMDAWAHVAETTSRTLGVDPLRVNKDLMGNWLPGAAVFFKQPARVSNLAMHYLANGEMSKFYWMLGAMAAAGGESAIPDDAKQIWERIDPNSYFMAAAALDKAEIMQYITGKSMSNKTKWSIVSPLMSSTDPLRTSSGNLLTSTKDALDDMAEGKFDNSAHQAIGNMLSLFAPQIAGMPAKQILNIRKASGESSAGEKRVSYYDAFGGQNAPSEDVPLADMDIDPNKNVLDVFLPGEQKPVEERKIAAEQAKLNEQNWSGIWGPLQPMIMGNSDREYFNNRFDLGPIHIDKSKAYDPTNLLFKKLGLTGSKK